jgi:nitrilase
VKRHPRANSSIADRGEGSEILLLASLGFLFPSTPSAMAQASSTLNSGTHESVPVAVVQPRAFPFDPDGAVAEVGRLTRQAAEGGARLVLFPEAFVGGYPWGLRFGTSVGARTEAGKDLFLRYWQAAIPLPGPESEALGAIARENDVFLAVGVIERLPGQGSTLYCTLCTFGPDGRLLAIHRKLKPTAAERLIWGEGDGSTLPVVETELGRVGGLICWENYMPLARMALYGKGVEIYLAPTADARDRWQATLRHIAVEGRCFVLGCNQYVTRDRYPNDLPVGEELDDWPAEMCRGGSVIYGPDGRCLAGPLHGEPGILHADLELSEIARQKFEFDAVGHYARPDVFRLEVDEEAHPAVRYSGGAGHHRAD